MNNPKSVSEDIQAFVNRLKEQGYYFDIDSQEDAESVWQIIDEFYKHGIQEGRRQEVERAKNYLKRLCWNDKDIELFEKWQSRNEGSEKHGE